MSTYCSTSTQSTTRQKPKIEGRNLMPLVSVIVPTQNRPAMLASALESVRAQTFTDYEIIVISSDEDGRSATLSRAAAERFYARRLWTQQPGVSVARNLGIAEAAGEWIAFLDDDDLWMPDKLERQIAAAELSGADMIATDYIENFDTGAEIIRRPRLPAGVTFVEALNHLQWWAATPTVMVRKSVVQAVGGFDPRLYYGEDGDLWRRISQRHTICQMAEILVRVRRGHPSLTKRSRMMKFYDILHWLKMYRDTPDDLRWSLPSFWHVVAPRIAELTIPKLVRQPLHPGRLRRRWKALRGLFIQRGSY